MQRSHWNHSEAGVSLIELLVYVGVMGALLSAAATVFFTLTRTNVTETAKIEAQIEALELVSVLRKHLSQAVDIKLTSGSLNGATISADDGRVRNFTWNQFGHGPGPQTLALFVREASTVTASDLAATGLFWVPPTPNTSGVIFIDPGRRGGVVAQNLSPSYDKPYFGNLVAFSIEPRTAVGGGNEVTSAVISFQVRYFLEPGDNVGRWCPVTDMAAGVTACKDDRNFKDISQVFTVKFRNNGFGAEAGSGLSNQRLFGPVYFFQSWGG